MAESELKSVCFSFAVVITACFGSMATGIWIGWSSPANFLIHNNKTDLVISDLGTMTSMYDLGNIVSPIPTGWVLSWIGRKNTILLIGPMTMVSWILILVWPSSVKMLYAARLLSGIAKGIVFCAIPMYVGEISLVKYRGIMLSIFPVMLTLGISTVQFTGLLMTYQQLNIFGLIYATLFTLMFLPMPESPYYHMQNDRKDEAEKLLKKIRFKDDVSDELSAIEITVQTQMQNKTTYRELFTNKGNRRAFIITAGACLFQRFSGISPYLHFSSTTLPSKNAWVEPRLATFFFTGFKGVSSVASMLVMDRIGRKPLMLASHTLMALCTAAHAVFLYLATNTTDFTAFNWCPVVSLWIYGVVYAFGAGTLCSVLMGEMFAVNVKTKAAPLCVMCLAGASFLLDKIYTDVSHIFGVYANYALYTVLNLAWALTAMFIMIETKGSTFLEIQQKLNDAT